MSKIRIKVLIISILCIGLKANAQNILRTTCDGNISRLDSMLQTTDINRQNSSGFSVLLISALCDQQEAFDFLIDKGAEVNVVSEAGETPLLLAAGNGNVEMVKSLLEKGAEVNVVNRLQRTPIFEGVRRSNEEIVKLLLSASADLNLGGGLLHRAVMNDNVPIAQILIDAGIEIDALNDRQNTALEIALRQNSEQMAKLLVASGADRNKVHEYSLSGPYLGQEQPVMTAQIFADGFISTEDFTHTPAFSPDEKEFYYTLESRREASIMVSRLQDGKWTKPERADIDGDFREIDPFISNDGRFLYYSSDRPLQEGDSVTGNVDLWRVQKQAGGWGKPEHLGAGVTTPDAEWFPTLADNGNLYFSTGPGRSSNIVFSEFREGEFQQFVSLGDSVNSSSRDYDPVITRDESFVVFSSNRPGGFGSVDLYVSFRKDDGGWTKARNLGETVNTDAIEFAPKLSRDGKYLFFNRKGDIWWISAEVIMNLR